MWARLYFIHQGDIRWDGTPSIYKRGVLSGIVLKGFFDQLDHSRLLEMLESRIDDNAFLGLIRQWLKAGILEIDGQVVHPQTGSPQGGIISPVLANVYLHHVLDEWFEQVVKGHIDGKAMLIRYADDYVCMFQYKADAARFYRTMVKRLGSYGLETVDREEWFVSAEPI